MDRALKERLVGAVVLMAFIVLVVPVFLDGPESEPAVVSETVTLPGQDGQPRKRQTIVLERDRTEPVPTGNTGAPESSAGTPEAETPAPRPEPAAETPDPAEESEAGAGEPATAPAAPEAAAEAPQAEPAAPADEPEATPETSATGMWAVQLGSFSNQANAERLAADLREAGFAAFLSRLEASGGPLHRVRVGPQKDRDSAEAMAKRLADSGHRGQVVPHP